VFPRGPTLQHPPHPLSRQRQTACTRSQEGSPGNIEGRGRLYTCLEVFEDVTLQDDGELKVVLTVVNKKQEVAARGRK
jgi:hypothetical protein